MKVTATNSTRYAVFESRSAGGSLRSIFRSSRFYLRVDSWSINTDIFVLNPVGGSLQDTLQLNTDGTFKLGWQNTGTTSISTIAFNDGVWHLIEVEIISSTSRKLFVDNTLFVTDSTSGGGVAQTSANLGIGVDGTAGTGTIYFDDVMFDDGDAQIGAGQSILVNPTTDPGSLNSWTAGAGGTSNLWDAVNNAPPVGLPPTGCSPGPCESNTSQIKNAASGGSLDYIATTQSYAAAGVGSSDTVNAVMAIGNDCEEITTGTKAGGYWIGTNPAQTAGGQTFDFGNDVAAGCGAFPSAWATHIGSVTTSGITIGSTATVAIRKTTSTTRATDADFLGIYVDYLPCTVNCGVKRLPMLGIGAWLLTRVIDIYNSLFEPSVAFAQSHSPKPKDTVDADFLGIYVDYTPSEVIPASPHFTPTPTTSRSR
jgi:hypothetical protein